ncbi:hypothetical protein [Erythrobacter sp. QSSC1-22B]|uniref:hypothetical protein n=1 Tax=Erythrobacter sp. QSSC1-22B TaxID=1860125 RepID=UPI00143A7A64|nr:hypothetical protein [Erythrobacter sp. QSSC1-22B]
MEDPELREMQTRLPGMTDECVDRAHYGGIAAISSLAVDECFKNVATPKVSRDMAQRF